MSTSTTSLVQGIITTDVSGYDDQGYSVAIQPDGKILLGGTSQRYDTYNSRYEPYTFALVRYNSDGSLDASFGGDGKVTTALGSDAFGRSVVVQADGKILLGGSDEADTEAFALVRYNVDGSLDTSFNGDGKVTTTIGDYSFGNSVALQPDGKILLGGFNGTSSYNENFALVRYNADGSLDTSFGGNGIVTTELSNFYSDGNSVALQADGKILLGGTTWVDSSFGDKTDFALVRYNTDGSLDTSFDGDGVVTTSVGIHDEGRSVTVQADGKILLGGYSGSSPPYENFALVRYNTDGSLDTSFGKDGTVTTLGVSGESVSIQTDGKILLGGGDGRGKFALVRYNSNGSLDTSFDGDGLVITSNLSGDNYGLSVAVQADAKILLGGIYYDKNKDFQIYGNDFALVRYNSDGSLDTSFTGSNLVNNTPAGTVTITGNPINGQILTVSNNLADIDGLGLITYQWKANDTSITGATNANYVLTEAEVGKAITVTASYIDGHGTAESVSSIATMAVDNVNDSPTGSVTIAGTAMEGQTLTVANTLADADGLGPISYQWNANNVPIVGATNATYLITQSEVGKIITVTASYIDGHGTKESATSCFTTVITSAGISNLILNGSTGQDLLTGGAGNDTLTGGAGNDVFLFSANQGIDRITDFSDGDVLRISGFTPNLPFSTGTGNNLSASQVQLANTAGISTLYIGLNATPGSDLAIELVGNWLPTQFRANGNDIVFNHAPTVNVALADQPIVKDTALTVKVPDNAFTDIDTSSGLTYSATQTNGSALPSWLTFDTNSHLFSGTPNSTHVGTLSVKVTVTDSSLASTSDTFDIVVSNDPNTPTITNPIADQKATEDAAFSFTLPTNTFTTINANALTYSASLADGSVLPNWLTFNTTTRMFSGTPDNSQVGTLSIKVTAKNSNQSSVSDTFDVVIANVNDAPTLTNAIVDQKATEDQLFSFTVPANTFTEVDAGDTLSYSATQADGSALPSWLTFDTGTHTFSGTPDNAQVGTLNIKVTVKDGSQASINDSFVITVTNVNDAPTLVNEITDPKATEDTPFSFTVPANTFADPDTKDTLSYSATLADGSALPAWLTFNATTQIFTGKPENAQVGSLSIKVTAKDGSQASASDTFNVVVANVNDVPTLTKEIEDQKATEDQLLSFTVPTNTFTEVDAGDTLSYSATQADGSALPSWLTFDTGTHTFSGTPDNAQVGTLNIKVTVKDGSQASINDSFVIAVANVNDAPSSSNHTHTLMEDTSLIFAASDFDFIDVDTNDTFQSLRIDSLPSAGLLTLANTAVSISQIISVSALQTGLLIFTPDTNQSGLNYSQFKFSVSDGSAFSKSYEQIINVTSLLNNLTLIGTDQNDKLIGDQIDVGSFDSLTGLEGNDVLRGLSGNDTLDGGSGRDMLDGGLDADSMMGGSGNDTYVVDNIDDVVIETNQDASLIDTVNSYLLSYQLPANIENLRIMLKCNANAIGNELANLLYASSANNVLNGETGNDTVSYQYGASSGLVINLNSTSSQTTLGSKNDTLLSIENLIGSKFNDRLTGNIGDNLLNGGNGNDVLTGGAGDDILIGNKGIDTANYSDNSTEIKADLTTGKATGVGNDQLIAIENIEGGQSNDKLTGNNTANQLSGNEGMDWLNGKGGDDRLIGNQGQDTLIGDSGADRFVYTDPSDTKLGFFSRDIIVDFSRLQGDKLDVSGLDGNPDVSGIQKWSFVETDFTGISGQISFDSLNGLVKFDSNGDTLEDMEIQLNGVTSLNALDFVF